MACFRIYIFGLGIAYFGWQLIDPNTVVLAPDGFTWKTSFKSRHWAWNDVSNFGPMQWGQFGWDISGRPQFIWLWVGNECSQTYGTVEYSSISLA